MKKGNSNLQFTASVFLSFLCWEIKKKKFNKRGKLKKREKFNLTFERTKRKKKKGSSYKHSHLTVLSLSFFFLFFSMDRLTQLQDAIDAVKIYACCITF